jgi:hypothetical protein
MEWQAHSYPAPYTSRLVPNGRVSSTPLDRWYTSDRLSLSSGRPSESLSTMYCLTSGRIVSRMYRRFPMTGKLRRTE